MLRRALLLGAGTAALLICGVPLGPTGLVLGALIGYLGLALPLPSRRAVPWLVAGFAAALALKLVLVSTAPPTGLLASYWAKAAPDGPAEQSIERRTDAALDLRGDQFAVAFFNDAARFNFGADAQPGRDQLPFSVRWQGWLDVPSDGQRRFVVESSGPAQLWLDGVQVLDPQQSELEATLSQGQHALRVDYSRPEARVPRIRVTWQPRPGAPLEVLGGSAVRWTNESHSLLSGQAPSVSDLALAAVLLAWLGLALRQMRQMHLWRATVGALPLLFLAHGMLVHGPLIGRTSILSGLDDWLIYESSARDILLDGPLMTGGQGRAAPYYGQPLYPYVLAVVHWLGGEGLFAPLALQFAALGGVFAMAAVLARRAFGSRLAGLAALAGVLIFAQAQGEYWRVARQLFNENLYMPLVMAGLIALVDLARRGRPPSWWRMLLVGLLLGVTAISRSQFLAFVPLGLVVLAAAWLRRRASVRRTLVALTALTIGMLLAIAPITTRNWLVSGQPVLITASGGASLLEFHRPPPGLIDSTALRRDPLFEALHLDPSTRTVLAFVRQDPLGYLATWLPLGAHSVGLPGRTGLGIYWPLLLTVLLYLAAFGLRRTRRLHVWPIHAFVATHLLVLMLFEADTYGYRLVMPMYAPMLAVAAQVPLALLRRLAWPGPALGSAAPRWASAALGLCAGLALLFQAGGVIGAWPDRETSLLGLGGAAAHAATTAERAAADVIYVASVDGTPRHFGAGSLPGLRVPWFKWFDPSRSLPLPAAGSTAVYALSEISRTRLPGDLVACLGPIDPSAERVVRADEARQLCTADLPADAQVDATIDGLARVDAVVVPLNVAAGDSAETRLLWQPLVAHPEPYLFWLHLEDSESATLWGNSTLDLYPARQWQPGESLLSRLPLTTDPTAIPDRYPLTLGMNAARANAAPATVTWHGQRTDRVPLGTLVLLPSAGELALDALPADMQPVSGVAGGGLELIAARAPAADAWPGKRVRIGLLWRALNDAPSQTSVRLRLVHANGEVVQESVHPILGGRALPSLLRAGSVVRDEQTLEIGASVSGSPLTLEVGLTHGLAAIGTIDVAGRQHVFDAPSTSPETVFGARMGLLSHRVDPESSRPGGTITVHLNWRAQAAMAQSYKVFVHVLDARAERVVAQRDAEPLDGRAPTPGWVVGEVLEDEYRVVLPADVAAGEYRVEVGVYEERSGERLALASGENRLLLDTRLHVR